MIPCETRGQLLKNNDDAWQEWYACKGQLEQALVMRRSQSEIGGARQAFSQAKKRVSNSMGAILGHYRKHGCNRG
jgi:hypothetical protein